MLEVERIREVAENLGCDPGIADRAVANLTTAVRWRYEAVERAKGRRIATVVCGLPSSGNRLMSHYLHRLGAVQAMVLHGNDDPQGWLDKRATGHELYAVMMVRDPVCWRMSARRSEHLGATTDAHEFAEGCYQTTLRWVLERGAKFRAISYEALCRNAQGIADELADWIGLRRLAWPDDRLHDDEPWMGPPSGDPNLKYLREGMPA